MRCISSSFDELSVALKATKLKVGFTPTVLVSSSLTGVRKGLVPSSLPGYAGVNGSDVLPAPIMLLSGSISTGTAVLLFFRGDGGSSYASDTWPRLSIAYSCTSLKLPPSFAVPFFGNSSVALGRLPVLVTLLSIPDLDPEPLANLSKPNLPRILDAMRVERLDSPLPVILVARSRKYFPKRDFKEGAQAQMMAMLHSATDAAKTLNANQVLSSWAPWTRPR
jgi:hypothetical protein